MRDMRVERRERERVGWEFGVCALIVGILGFGAVEGSHGVVRMNQYLPRKVPLTFSGTSRGAPW